MAILKVARLGHPVLRQVSEPVPADEILTAGFQSFLDDLIESMHEMDGVGLAAPQVHRSQRAVVYQVEEKGRPAEGGRLALKVLINPVVTPLGDDRDVDWEGCLSVPDLRGRVPRFTRVRVQALDRKRQPLDYVANGFHARVVQHETDHLDGVVYLDRMTDMASLTFLEEFDRYGERES